MLSSAAASIFHDLNGWSTAFIYVTIQLQIDTYYYKTIRCTEGMHKHYNAMHLHT